MNSKSVFPRYYQDPSAQFQVKLISAKQQSCVRAFTNGQWFDYMTAMEPVKANTIQNLEANFLPSSEETYLEKLGEVLSYYDKIRQKLGEKLQSKPIAA
jgi:hypothetical protein